jgi:hypothetical protein
MRKYRPTTDKPRSRVKKYREGGPVGEPAGERIMLDEVDVVAPKFQPKGLFKGVRKRIAENINPYSYARAPSRVMKALLGIKESEDTWEGDNLTERQALFDIAMGQPVRDKAIGALTVSEYQPSNSSDPSAVYFRSPVTEDEIKYMYKNVEDVKTRLGGSLQVGDVGSKALEYSDTLGDYTISIGEDEKGKYISYYDLWDLDPFQHRPFMKRFGDEAEQLQSAIGITSPEVYGRLYFQENPDGSITYLDGEGQGSKKKYRNETKED